MIGTQKAEDGYDVIEALAKMEWCKWECGVGRECREFVCGNCVVVYCCSTTAFLSRQLRRGRDVGIFLWSSLLEEEFFNISNFDLITRFIIQGNYRVEDLVEMYRRSSRVANAS